jgi:probable rRNA maturation factor
MAKETLLYLNQQKSELSILFVDNDEMKALNSDYRGVYKTTDVLAFEASIPGIPSHVLGDVVINALQAERQAMDYEVEFDEEIHRLLTHGILHLLGFDHERSEEDDLLMMQKQEEIIRHVKEAIGRDKVNR